MSQERLPASVSQPFFATVPFQAEDLKEEGALLMRCSFSEFTGAYLQGYIYIYIIHTWSHPHLPSLDPLETLLKPSVVWLLCSNWVAHIVFDGWPELGHPKYP